MEDPKALTDDQIKRALDRAFKEAKRSATKSVKPKRKKPRYSQAARTAKAVQLNADRLVSVQLRLQHIRNGVVYGPGVVTVPNNIAQDMLHTEQQRARVEERFYGQHAALIGPQVRGAHVIKEVPYESFDAEANANEMFAGRVKGTAHGPDTGSGNKF